MTYKYIGTISSSLGIRGRMSIANSPASMAPLLPGTKLKIGFSEQFSKEFTLRLWRQNNKRAELTLDEVTSDADAQKLKEQGIYIDESLITFDDKESYYVDDLIGCKVVNQENGDVLGLISDVWILPANDVWVISNGETTLPIPYIEQVVKKVDLISKIIEIELIDGLMELKSERKSK